MGYELYNQLLGRAGKRQLADPSIGVAHNLGGWPMSCVAGIAIYGRLGQ